MLRGVLYSSAVVSAAVMRFFEVDIMTFFYVMILFAVGIGIIEYKEGKEGRNGL